MARFLNGEYYNEIDYCNFIIIEIKTGLWRGYYGEYKYEHGDTIPKKLPKGYIYLPKEDYEDYRASRIRQNGKIVQEKVNQRILKQILKQIRIQIKSDATAEAIKYEHNEKIKKYHQLKKELGL